ncbi:HYExAFE family protein [Gemmata sp. JC673]|uniref:HYExAFE family protein n=1 Tax=Gemmata algarum TaxID=2975278 RepID=A0ABU5ETX6_9BACT|nr:HYExAFE family protein [Gemmata algarum]MDY3558699.1 HYExAFE family protein [Gemmata algarum]
MKADNHYEVAFDAFLRARGCAVVPVVESRRSYLDTSEVKSPDFLTLAPAGAKLVIDVKGRKFPGAGKGGTPRRSWQNWCELEDVESLARWSDRLGDGFLGVLAFVYDVALQFELPPCTPDVFAFRGHVFLFRGVSVGEYRRHMRTRSPRWRTVHLPSADFRRLVKPITHFLRPADANAEELLTGSTG